MERFSSFLIAHDVDLQGLAAQKRTSGYSAILRNLEGDFVPWQSSSME
jgi:hypothetical protein